MSRAMLGGGKALDHKSGHISASSSDSSGSERGAPLTSPTPEEHRPRNEKGAGVSKKPTPPSSKASKASGASNGGPPPAFNLVGYPGPVAAHQRPPSVPSLLPAPPVMGGVPVPVAMPKMNGRGGAIPGATTQTFISAMQAITFNPADEDLNPEHKTMRDQICKLQTRVWGLRQGMYRQSSIPREFLTSFDYDMQEMMSNTVKLNKAADTMAEELKQMHDEYKRLQAGITKLEQDSQAWKGRQYELEMEQMRLLEENNEDRRTIQYLKDQLRQMEMTKTLLQDQVEGKRSLWMDVHRDPQERAAAMQNLAMTRVPTPAISIDQSQTYGSGHVGSIPSGSIYSASDHSTGGHYLGTHQVLPIRSHSGPGPLAYSSQSRLLPLATASHRSSIEFPNSKLPGKPSPNSSAPKRSPRYPTTTDFGSPHERRLDSSGALVRVSVEDIEFKVWSEEFEALFALIRGFCSSYFHDLPTIDGDWKTYIKAEANGILWDYMNGVCQPGGEQDRGERALRLLKDDACRPYLMERLIVQHIIVYIFTYEGWKDYSDDIDEEMFRLEEHLKEINPRKIYERQAMIDRRADLVTEMSTGPNSAAFKNHKVNQHHQHIKTMVAPFLPRDKKSTFAQEAFYDLFAIAGQAWDMSAKLFRSRLTFQHVWNDAYTRFSTEVHKPLGLNMDPIVLQIEHWRVKLCVTPAITMRNDQGMTISTRNVLKSGVLVMRY